MEIVTGALPSLLPKLADLLIGEYNLQKEVKGGIIFLQAELESMKGALEKISETPADQLDKQDKLWARDVRELSYDIEDKIDTFLVCCKGSRLQHEQHGLKTAIDKSLRWLMQPKIRRKIAMDIRDISDLDMYSTKRHSNISREFVIGAGSFPCLVRCKLRGYYERVVFHQGAMPWLTSLELDVYREVWSTWTGIPDLDFENLSSLLDLHVGLQHGRGSTAAEQAIGALMHMAEIHPNHPSVSVSCYYQYL